LLCTGVHGTSNGAPDSVCQNANMFPSGHNSAAATGPSPYSITVDAEQYAAGASLTGKTGYGCQLLKYFSKFAVCRSFYFMLENFIEKVKSYDIIC